MFLTYSFLLDEAVSTDSTESSLLKQPLFCTGDKTNKMSLIRVVAVRMKKPWVLSYSLSAQRRLGGCPGCLSLRWAHSHFVGFVMSRLIYFQLQAHGALTWTVLKASTHCQNETTGSYILNYRVAFSLFLFCNCFITLKVKIFYISRESLLSTVRKCTSKNWSLGLLTFCFGTLYIGSDHARLYGPGHAKMCLMPYANNKGADQPAHPRSLISTFTVRCLDSMIYIFAISKVSRI